VPEATLYYAFAFATFYSPSLYGSLTIRDAGQDVATGIYIAHEMEQEGVLQTLVDKLDLWKGLVLNLPEGTLWL
jgi:hypothetical protein